VCRYGRFGQGQTPVVPDSVLVMRRPTVVLLAVVSIALSVGIVVTRRRRSEAVARIVSMPPSLKLSLSADSSPSASVTVALIGDSIIHMSASAISDALQARYCLTVRAQPGAKLCDLDALTGSLLSPDAERFPDAIVITLGTNDVTGRTREWVEQWTTLLHRIAPVPGVILFTVNRHADGLGKRFLEGPSASDLNGAIARADAAPNVVVVDWDAAVQADVELVWDRGERRGDFVHPSVKGQRWIAEQIRAALDDLSHARG
jgi:lysophospholipase L1-like esterase